MLRFRLVLAAVVAVVTMATAGGAAPHGASGLVSAGEAVAMDVGPLAGTLTRVCACPDGYGFLLNNRGDVAWSQVQDPESMGFFWRQGRTTRLGRDTADVNDLNDRGQVVGWSDLTSGGYVWANGRMTPLALTGPNTIPKSINEAGQVVGALEARPPATSQHAFLWHNGKLRDLGALKGTRTSAEAVNERGQVVGNSTALGGGLGSGKGFLWENGRMGALPKPRRADVYVSALTERGEVLWRGPDDIAFLWRPGRLIDLTRLGGKRSVVAEINGRGQIVGWFRDRDWKKHAFLWQDGRLRDLGTLGGPRSEALALNGSGDVVGLSETSSGKWKTFVWRAGTMREIGAFRPIAVNVRGQVLGARDRDVVLWTPKAR